MTDVDGKAFILCALAVWRIAHLLAHEDGPFDMIVTLRSKAGQGFLGSLLDCFLCLTLWIAIPFVFLLGADWISRVVTWLALSGAASILFMFSDRAVTK